MLCPRLTLVRAVSSATRLLTCHSPPPPPTARPAKAIEIQDERMPAFSRILFSAGPWCCNSPTVTRANYEDENPLTPYMHRALSIHKSNGKVGDSVPPSFRGP